MFRHLIKFAMVAAVLWLSPAMMATELLMPQFGYQEITLQPGEEIDFYDMKGTSDISSSSSNNSFSAIIFHPAAEGQAVQIVFEEVDVRNDGSNWPAYLAIYDGVFDTSSISSWPTSTSEVTQNITFPETDSQLARLDGTFSNLTYTSSTSDGALSIGYQYRYAKACKGWTAKVRSVTLEDMAIVSVSTDYSGIPSSVYGGKKNVELASINVATSGLLNPFTLTGISVTVSGYEALSLGSVRLTDASGTSIDAEVTINDDSYTFTLSRELSAGNNVLKVVTDIDANAPFNTVITPTVTAVTTTAVNTPALTNGSSASTTVAAMVCMPSDPITVSVDAAGFNFYDDGGPEGSVSKDFEGQITFIPGVEGQKVMIDFSKLDLFNTSSTGLNDILNIYNGTAATGENLLINLLNEKQAIVHSTSADGALTLTFKCTTGYPKTGWEAFVSCFTPQTMTVSEVNVAQASTAIVGGGDTDAEFLTANIITTNTEPALSLTGLILSLSNQNNRIERVKVYSTKRDSGFSTSHILGSATVSGDNATITFDTPLTLAEGNNYLHVTADIAPNAVNGEVLDLALTSLIFGDETVIIDNGDPAGSREVKNIVYATVGSKIKTVYNPVEFKNEPYSSYYEGYTGDSQDRVVTFLPGQDGNVVQLDFTKFNFYYYYYGGTFATFNVYNGTDTSSDPIFKLTTDNRSQIPASIRSTSPDGALTVLFNGGSSNASSSTYGFAANVSLYELTPMVIGDVTVSQPETGIIPCTPRAERQNLLKVHIATVGGLDPLAVNELTLDLKGCADALDRVYLTSSGNSDALAINGVKAYADIDPAKQIVTLTPDNFNLVEGDNYLWINADMKEGILADREIDAKISSIKIDGVEVNVINPDPEGSRFTRNIYNMLSGTGHEVTVDDQTLMFYDDGGAEEAITKYFSGTTTFKPKDEGKAIRLDISSLSLSYNEKMEIFFGEEATGTADVTIDNYSSAPLTVISTADNGAMTVRFTSSAYSPSNGWEATVTQYVLQPLAFGQITSEAINAAESLRGSEAKVLKVTVPITGDKGSVPVDDIVTSIEGEGVVSALHIYDCGKSDSFVSTVPIEAGNFTYTAPGTYYIYITADISSEAQIGATAAVVLEKITSNGIDYDVAGTCSSEIHVVSGMSGSYTIGNSSDADYVNFGGAVNAMLARGIEGPVTFTVATGEYAGEVTIPEIPGASAINTITFVGETGNPENVVLSISSDPNTSLMQEIEKKGVITIAGADYVTFSGLTLSSSVATNTLPAVVYLHSGSQHISIDNCVLSAPKSTSAGTTTLVKSYCRSEENSDLNHGLTVKNSTLSGGYSAITYGSGYTTLGREDGLLVENCTFTNQGSKFVYLNQATNAVVCGNTMSADSPASSCYMIDLTIDGASRIEGNNISVNFANGTNYLFYLRTIDSAEDNPTIIANNAAMLTTSGSSSVGAVYFSTNHNGWLNFAHNTIKIKRADGATATTNRGIFFYRNMKGSVVNNLIEVEGGVVFRSQNVSSVATIANVSFANNHCIALTTGTSYGDHVGTAKTFDEWNEHSGQTGSIEAQAVFEEGALKPSEPGQLVNGKPLSYVTIDIDGVARAARPTIGAYEYVTNTADDAYTHGVLFLNEDQYGSFNSSLSYLDLTTDTWTHNAFQAENPGLSLGETITHGTIYGGKLYVVCHDPQDAGDTSGNTGARFTVADAGNLKMISRWEVIGDTDIDSSVNGRAFLGVDLEKAYISTSDGIKIYNLVNDEFEGVVYDIEGNALTGQIGMMVRRNDYVFAATAKKGIIVIDPASDQVTKVINPAEIVNVVGAGVGSVVLSKDGSVWASVTSDTNGGVLPYLLKIDAETLTVSTVDIPDGIYPPASTWYAFTPDGFCASTQNNALYWNGGEDSYNSGQTVIKYDIDTNSFSKHIELGATDYIYGASMRVNPMTDKLYAGISLGTQYGNNYEARAYDSDGSLSKSWPFGVTHYWFPSTPLFPDVYAPEAVQSEAIAIDFSKESFINIDDIAVDADNMSSAMVKTVIDNSAPDVLNAYIEGGTLHVAPAEASMSQAAPRRNDIPGNVTVTVRVNSNGRYVDVPLILSDDIATSLESAEIKPHLRVVNGCIIADGCDAEICVYDLSGRCLLVIPAGTERTVELNYPAGVYVIKCGNTALKVVL